MALVPCTLRLWARTAILQQAVDGYVASQPTTFPAAFRAASSLMVFSGATHALMHVAAVPLPLLPQLLFQLVCLPMLVALQLAPATACLSLTPYVPQLRRMCTSLNGGLVLAASAHSGVYLHLGQLDRVCEDNAVPQMVLFVQLYFVLAVPLYYAHRLQQECCHHILHPRAASGRQQEGLPDGTALGTVAGDVAILLIMVMVCWLAAIVALPYLPQVVWPLAAPTTTAAA